jgi:hypothetical protein
VEIALALSAGVAVLVVVVARVVSEGDGQIGGSGDMTKADEEARGRSFGDESRG